MGLFSPYKDKEQAKQPAEAAEPSGPRPAGKAAPTPTRRQAEEARRNRARPQLTPKEARRKQRVLQEQDRRKNMAAVDARPAKVLMRDFIDSRFNVAEYSMPVMMLLLLLTLTVAPYFPPLVEPTLYATWAFLGLVVIDQFVMWRKFKKLAAVRIPNEPLKGILNYGFNRSMSFRRIRSPRPRVKRGDTI